MDNRTLQMELKKAGFYLGEIDDEWGPLSAGAAYAFLEANGHTIEQTRQKLAAEQLIYFQDKIEVGLIDGYLGPQTIYAREVYKERHPANKLTVENWRDAMPPSPGVAAPAIKEVRNKWPKDNQAECLKFFGPIGSNHTKLVFPYDCYYDGKVVKSTVVHEKVHDAALRIFKKVLEHYGPQEIHRLSLDQFGGCFNPRKKRGGTTWSIHAWAAAFDFDAAHNMLKQTHQTARFAKPEYIPWFEFWEEEGAMSLGRHADYDWMHTQFAHF